jgi:hypothetical protein
MFLVFCKGNILNDWHDLIANRVECTKSCVGCKHVCLNCDVVSQCCTQFVEYTCTRCSIRTIHKAGLIVDREVVLKVGLIRLVPVQEKCVLVSLRDYYVCGRTRGRHKCCIVLIRCQHSIIAYCLDFECVHETAGSIQPIEISHVRLIDILNCDNLITVHKQNEFFVEVLVYL